MNSSNYPSSSSRVPPLSSHQERESPSKVFSASTGNDTRRVGSRPQVLNLAPVTKIQAEVISLRISLKARDHPSPDQAALHLPRGVPAYWHQKENIIPILRNRGIRQPALARTVKSECSMSDVGAPNSMTPWTAVDLAVTDTRRNGKKPKLRVSARCCQQGAVSNAKYIHRTTRAWHESADPSQMSYISSMTKSFSIFGKMTRVAGQKH